MKTYIKTINFLQKFLLKFSVIFFLIFYPTANVFWPEYTQWIPKPSLFQLSLLAVLFVMSIRPLADIFPEYKFIRPLVILRKGFGVFSASIIIGLFLTKIISSGGSYISEFTKEEYWSLKNYALLAHLGDWTALILLITSNKFSKQILGKWWKRIQKLAYVYFYSGAFYEFLVFNDMLSFWAIIIVTVLVIYAYFYKKLTQNKYENN